MKPVLALGRNLGIEAMSVDVETSAADRSRGLDIHDIVFLPAGTNRPWPEDDFGGRSKDWAEELLFDCRPRTDRPARKFRLPGVFGKGSRPNHGSVKAVDQH